MAPGMHLIKSPVSITCHRQRLMCNLCTIVVVNQNETQTVTHLRINGRTDKVLVSIGWWVGVFVRLASYSAFLCVTFTFFFFILLSLREFKTKVPLFLFDN